LAKPLPSAHREKKTPKNEKEVVVPSVIANGDFRKFHPHQKSVVLFLLLFYDK